MIVAIMIYNESNSIEWKVMELFFWKMHGLGNDFIIMDECDSKNIDVHTLAIQLCDRHLGIGADGIMIVLPSERADIRMQIINSDGSEAEMCGNGIRCFAKYVYEKGKIQKERFTIETLAGIMEPALILKNGMITEVKVNMGKPDLERAQIPMIGAKGPVINDSLEVGGENFLITSMLMGVPHTMVFVDQVDQVDIAKIGSQIERHRRFPRKTNVNFIEIINRSEMKVRTWERGAGITLACGTGCCACVVAGVLNGKTERKVTVHLAVGDLQIEWAPDGTVFMTGPARKSFEGNIEI